MKFDAYDCQYKWKLFKQFLNISSEFQRALVFILSFKLVKIRF
jgi:hypothetical protein